MLPKIDQNDPSLLKSVNKLTLIALLSSQKCGLWFKISFKTKYYICVGVTLEEC